MCHLIHVSHVIKCFKTTLQLSKKKKCLHSDENIFLPSVCASVKISVSNF